jgi:Nif-specific regulatory protein
MLTSLRHLPHEESFGEKASERRAQCLYEVSQILSTAPAPGSLTAALRSLCTCLGLRGASLSFRELPDHSLTELAAWPQAETPALAALVREGARRVLRDRMPLVVENAWIELGDSRDLAANWLDTNLDTSLVGVPIRPANHAPGALLIVREHSAGDQAAFSFDADVRLLGCIAKLMALVLQLAEVRAFSFADAKARSETERQPTAAVGKAVCWQATLRKAESAATTNATVLLLGETGVGKNVIAKLVHQASQRQARPFIAVNCAALPEALLESELFGHERGAFTGAVSQHKGRFELAHTGTLFLDEIGELSATFQAKLLRVLQQGELERVGGSTTLRVDVRIIAATHRDLEAAVRAGSFRADLYYRLCVIPIRVPPLRERAEDIALLARVFLERFNAENDSERALDETALLALQQYHFPGNVRELENAVRRAATLAEHPRLNAADFLFLREQKTPDIKSTRGAPTSNSPAPTVSEATDARRAPGQARVVSREQLTDALERAGWVLAKAARLLGVTPRQISYAAQKHGIAIPKY